MQNLLDGRGWTQNLLANFVTVNLLLHFERYIFISFWEQTYFLAELIPCFTEYTCRALKGIAVQSRKFNLSDGTQNQLDGS